MTSALENLCGPNKSLVAEPPDAKEFEGLQRSGRLRLKDAGNATLSLESRFDLAYNAAHALCLAALRRRGYRPRHRYIVFQVLPHTLGLGPEVWRVLAKSHEVRNLGEYEGDLDVDARLVDDLITACGIVAKKLESEMGPEEETLIARGLSAGDRARRTGAYVSSEEVLKGLGSRLSRAKGGKRSE
jgi:hypothetical protein